MDIQQTLNDYAELTTALMRLGTCSPEYPHASAWDLWFVMVDGDNLHGAGCTWVAGRPESFQVRAPLHQIAAATYKTRT